MQREIIKEQDKDKLYYPDKPFLHHPPHGSASSVEDLEFIKETE